MLLLAECRFGAGGTKQGRRAGDQAPPVSSEAMARSPHFVWGATTQLFTGHCLLKEWCGFFFFNTTLWGNLKAQDLKGI